jgi:hypothetical protein
MTQNRHDNPPPWQGLETEDPFEIPWNQGQYEPLMVEWWPFWNDLTTNEKAEYLAQHNPPERWKEYLDFMDRTQETDSEE